MNFQRALRFLRKSPEQRRITIRFFARKGLARLRYVPVPMRLRIPPEEITFWWSYVPQSNFADRPLLDYWGSDIGDLRFLWKVLQPGMVFFDVGAYHGLYTVVAAKKLGRQGRLVAFEPSPREIRRFRLHMRLNGVPSARLEPFAVSTRLGRLKLFTVVSGFTGMNSLTHPPIQDPVQEIVVDSVPLDEYLVQEGITRIDVMKVDTEGAELEVFAGAQRVLSEYRPLIICEVLDWVTRAWGYPAREIVNCLKQKDYRWFEFRPDGGISKHEEKNAYPEVMNYLAVPAEKLATVGEWIRP